MASHINRWVEPYCVLCRVTLPQNMYDPMIHNRDWEYTKEWDADVVMFFHIPHDGTGVWHRGSFHMNIQDSHTASPWSAGLMTRGFTECPANLDCDTCVRDRRHSTHYVHSHCFQLAKKFFPDTFSFARLVTAARYALTIKAGVHMRPDYVRATGGHEAFFEEVGGDPGTEVGKLLSTISRQFPPEIQTMIYGNGHPFLKSIHACVWNLSAHFRRFFETQAIEFTEDVLFPLFEPAGPDRQDDPSESPTPERQNDPSESPTPDSDDDGLETPRPRSPVDPPGPPRLGSLGINQTTILGQRTICEVGAGTTRQDWDSTIRLESGIAATGVQLSFGLYGLVAIKVLYGNGSESDWLGGTARLFYRTLRTRDLRRMRLKFDGFKIVDLDFPIEDEPCPHPESAMMNLNTRRHPGRKYPVVDNIDIEPPLTSRFVYYIPLPTASQRVECLTMWVSGGVVTNIQVNGDRATRVSPIPPPWHSRAVTHYFQPDETIESFHLLWHPGNDHRPEVGPCVILITSLGRTLYFGQYWDSINADHHLKTLGNFRTHQPVGIIMEPRKNVACLGAAIEPREHPLEEIHESILLPQRGPLEAGRTDIFDREEVRTSGFFSKASLMDAVRLKYQKHVNRVIGLYIEHRDGSIETMGRYDPGNPETIKSIYDANKDGPLQAITFGWSNVEHEWERVLLSIRNGRHDRPTNRFVWDDFTKEASWIFARSCDVVEYWTGRLIEFNRMPPPPTQVLQLQ